jgi:hypothetical protein
MREENLPEGEGMVAGEDTIKFHKQNSRARGCFVFETVILIHDGIPGSAVH